MVRWNTHENGRRIDNITMPRFLVFLLMAWKASSCAGDSDVGDMGNEFSSMLSNKGEERF